jgi:hypothetical protein
MRTYVFPTVWFQEGEAQSSAICYHYGTYRFMVKSVTENVMEAETNGLVMVVQFWAAIRNLLSDSGYVAAVCKWGR